MASKPPPITNAPGTERVATRTATPPIYQLGNITRENSMGYLMRRIVHLMVGQVDRRLEGTGLTHAQWTPLFLIHRGEANTLAALARDLQVDAGALTRTLDRLEAKGLCRRERSAEDRRVVHLRLTAAGRMCDGGLREVEAAKADGRWDAQQPSIWVTDGGGGTFARHEAEVERTDASGSAALGNAANRRSRAVSRSVLKCSAVFRAAGSFSLASGPGGRANAMRIAAISVS